jgi:hypothetical protein
VKNGTRHSLARIPLRWMIRECFKAHTGIIFDAHMLKHELGLDIESIYQAPKPLSSTNSRLSKPDGTEIVRSSLTSALVSPFRWILKTSILGPPLRWVWSKLPQLRKSQPPYTPHAWKFEGEDQEELDDALSPIYDQLKYRAARWQFMEVFSRNNGLGRIVDHRLKVHRSVRTRILARGENGEEEGYLPAVRYIIKGEAEPRRLTREEWMEDSPKHFKWVDCDTKV